MTEHDHAVVTAPGALPLIGHAGTFQRDPARFLASLSRHGDLVRIKMGPMRVLVVCHPALLDEMLVRDKIFDRTGPLFQRARDVVGNGVATCPHAEHRRQRRLVQPAFHKTRMPGYAAIASRQIAEHTAAWRAGQPMDVIAELNRLTCAVVARTLFSTEMDAGELARVVTDIQTVLDGLTRSAMTPPRLEHLPIVGIRGFLAARDRLRQGTLRLVSDYRRAGGDRGDLLSMLLMAGDAADGRLSDEEVCDQVLTFTMAGTETLANTMAWALHRLSRHPEVERRLHEEVDAVLDGRVATFDDLDRLEYTGQVIAETLRLHSPAFLFLRRVSTDAELGGAPVATGDTVLWSPHTIHYRPDLFPDPERFDPDRWAGDMRKTLPRGAYVPFGGGPRKCVGEYFALTEGTMALASIVARWRLRPTTDRPVRGVFRATLRPHALHLIPEPRARSSVRNQLGA
ncbi:cytochrome P450 [Nocardia tengchongensis]|uniref:cytochrome P450 n=1 Tax=Nocardia tengchongensis TaxID=2055889 RepID=UPI0033E05711